MEGKSTKKKVNSKVSEDEKKKSTKRKEEEKEEDEMEDISSEDEDEDDDENEEYIEVDDQENQEIQIDFEGFDFKPNDFFSVKLLLSNYLEGAEFNATELADIVVNQPGIGSILKAEHNEEDDNNFEEGFGFISVLNVHNLKDKPSIQQIKNFILGKIHDNSKKEYIKKLFEDESKPLGLLFNERMINVPAVVSYPLLNSLAEDIQYALEDDPKAPYRFSNFLMLSTMYKLSEHSSTSHQNKKTKSDAEWNYYKAEDEIFVKESVFSFTYGMATKETNKSTLDSTISQQRLIMVLPASKLNSSLKKVNVLVNGE